MSGENNTDLDTVAKGLSWKQRIGKINPFGKRQAVGKPSPISSVVPTTTFLPVERIPLPPRPIVEGGTIHPSVVDTTVDFTNIKFDEFDEPRDEPASQPPSEMTSQDAIDPLTGPTPGFIKDFSKKHSPEERKQLAVEIRAKRTEYFQKKEELEERLEKLNDVDDQIAVAAEMKTGFKSLTSETQEMLKQFYGKQVKKWETSDYTKEDIQKYFTEEHLSSLNLDQYLVLWRRFPSEVVTHVTRQGVRDHFGHSSHTAGLSEFHNNFLRLLKDGRIRSLFGHMMTTDEKEKAVSRYLELTGYDNRQQAFGHFENIIDSEGEGYPDLMAAHFATEQVADFFYGAESGNEIFFVFPSALIASQYYFRGKVAGEREWEEPKWNDLWVWANEEKGVPINAGLVFIPADARVDRKTGSKYETDESGKPIVNRQYVDQLVKFINSPLYKDFSSEIIKLTSELVTTTWENGHGYRPEKVADELQTRLLPYRERLKKDFGIEDEVLQNFVLNADYLNTYLKHAFDDSKDEPDMVETEIVRGLLKAGIYLKKSEDLIDSKDFWEGHFSQNPTLRPSKIVYYSGGDPSEAVYEFREQNNLTKRRKEDDLGFGEKRVIQSVTEEDSNTEVPFRGRNRFRSIILEVVDKMYPEET